MADTPEELDPTQATEAKLCAYLEGTLSAGERVEIEKYLTQSPTHRKLLRDLAATREWVSNLPKASAPPDIAEMFEQHAERSMLLDNSATPVSVSVNRGPQVMLAAAILLLVVGLGAIIFIVLNAKGPTAQNYASSMKPSPTPPAAPTTNPAPIPGTVARTSPAPPSPALPAAAMPYSRNLFTPAVAKAKPSATLPADVALAKIPTTMMAAAPSTIQSPEMRPQGLDRQSATTTTMFQVATNANQKFAAGVNNPTTQSAVTTAPTTQPTQVAVGDRLSVDIPQLVGPGVEKTTSVRVDPDGKITLPMLDAMPAAGKSTTDLQKQIADRYRQENLIANPIVTVTRMTPLPTSTPTTKPSTGPTTQPVR